MIVRELRIGNKIKIDGIVVTVDARTIFDFDYDISIKEPIPLTEEWLVRFGFELIEHYNFKPYKYKLGGIFFIIKNGSIVHLETSVVLKHVHQLQNLYFALTGQELEIKNTKK